MSKPVQREYLDWSLPASRVRLKIGDVLETYDCGYIAVKEITSEGVVQGNNAPGFPEHLWTWERLNFYQCCIIREEVDG